MNDLTLFDAPPEYVGRYRRTDPATSAAAAAGISGRTEQMILMWFRDERWGGGIADDELCELMNLVGRYHPPTVKSARSRLSRAGLLVDSGLRRPSNRGRQQIVWRLP